MLYIFRNYRFLPELLLVILIIAILAMMAIASYKPCIAKARVISVTGTFDTVRRDSQVYYALRGEWPQDASQAIQSGLEKSYENPSNMFRTIVENSAVSFFFDPGIRDVGGKTVTLRPVVQSDDPFGPVHWVCGDKDGARGWTIFGADRTSIEKKFIPWALR